MNDRNIDPNDSRPGAGPEPEWPGRAPERDPIPVAAGAESRPHDAASVEPPPVAPAEAAPVGLTTMTAPEPAPAPLVDWQDRYEKEHRRSRIFMATTAVAGALLVGSLFFAAAQGSSTDATAFGPGMQDRSGTGRGMAPGMPDQDGDASDPGMMGDRHGMGFGGAVEQLFNADGSLNTAAVEQFKEQIAGLDAAGQQALAEHIAGDVTRGHVTQDQADELLKALDLEPADTGTGSETGSGTGTGTGSTT